MRKVVPPAVTAAPSASPAKVPATGSTPSFVTTVKASPMAGANPRATARAAPFRSTVPDTASRSYWVPAVVPSRSTTRVVPAPRATPPADRAPGPASPGETVPPREAFTPGRVPVPPTVAAAAVVRPLLAATDPFTSRVPAFTAVEPV